MDRAHGSHGSGLSVRDRELDAGSRAHFEDPAYYDSAYRDQTSDVAYYRGLARGRDVLEYGIGNGRIAVPLARDGSRVTGIDHTAAMLADLREQLANEPPAVRKRITLRRGDMRRVRLGRTFPLVTCPFNTALHLYTRQDVEAWLARTREHLSPRGELVFDVSMPVLEDLVREPTKAYRMPAFDHPTHGRVSYRENFDYDRVRQILFVSMFFEPRKDASFMTPLSHRQFFPQELEALLHYNGFAIRDLYGDFARGPLTATSDVMVFHARPRRA